MHGRAVDRPIELAGETPSAMIVTGHDDKSPLLDTHFASAVPAQSLVGLAIVLALVVLMAKRVR